MEDLEGIVYNKINGNREMGRYLAVFHKFSFPIFPSPKTEDLGKFLDAGAEKKFTNFKNFRISSSQDPWRTSPETISIKYNSNFNSKY